MATSTPVLVSREEYLRTSYRPDRDWIDGEAKERNLGDQFHASVQGFFTHFFKLHAAKWEVRVFPELRTQVSARRYRVPDVCVIRRSAPFEPIVRTPPLLCIEILSPDDSMSDIQERVEDYATMGVASIWVIDPRRRRAYAVQPSGALEPVADALTVPATEIRIPVAEIFAELDEMQATR